MKVWAAVALVVFAALILALSLALSRPSLPARHLDIQASRYERVGNRARLTLHVLHVGRRQSVETEFRPPAGPGEPAVLLLRAVDGAARPEVGGESTVIVRDLPLHEHVRVLDLRWETGHDRPEGHLFVLSPDAGPATPPRDNTPAPESP